MGWHALQSAKGVVGIKITMPIEDSGRATHPPLNNQPPVLKMTFLT